MRFYFALTLHVIVQSRGILNVWIEIVLLNVPQQIVKEALWDLSCLWIEVMVVDLVFALWELFHVALNEG